MGMSLDSLACCELYVPAKPKGEEGGTRGNRTGLGASVGMRETVTSLKFKEGEALSKHNLKDRDVTTTLPLRGSEKAAHFVALIKL